MRVASTTGPGTALVLLALGVAGPAGAAEEITLLPRWPESAYIFAVNLLVLLPLIYPVNRFLLQPLVRVLAERDRRTAGALERAEELREAATGARGELAERLERARSDALGRRIAILGEGEQEQSRLLGEARAGAEREIDAVRDSVAQERSEARDALRDDARALAREAAARVLGRELA